MAPLFSSASDRLLLRFPCQVFPIFSSFLASWLKSLFELLFSYFWFSFLIWVHTYVCFSNMSTVAVVSWLLEPISWSSWRTFIARSSIAIVLSLHLWHWFQVSHLFLPFLFLNLFLLLLLKIVFLSFKLEFFFELLSLDLSVEFLLLLFLALLLKLGHFLAALFVLFRVS